MTMAAAGASSALVGRDECCGQMGALDGITGAREAPHKLRPVLSRCRLPQGSGDSRQAATRSHGARVHGERSSRQHWLLASRLPSRSLHTVSCPFALQVELKSGEIYRGELHEAEDNWNVQLTNVQATARDGKVTHMEHLFVRGSRVRFVIVPDMLKNAPMVSMAAVGCCMRCR